MSSSVSVSRRQSHWDTSEPTPFMTNGFSNMMSYNAEQENNGMPYVMTSPALLQDQSYQQDSKNALHPNGTSVSSKKNGFHNEEDSLSAKSCSSNDLPTPPDGGWGWVVVCVAILVNLVAVGPVLGGGQVDQSWTTCQSKGSSARFYLPSSALTFLKVPSCVLLFPRSPFHTISIVKISRTKLIQLDN